MLKAYKYEIYPNAGQRQQIEKTFGCCRNIYNLALTASQNSYTGSVNWNSFAMIKQLPGLKKAYPFFAGVDSQALIASLRNLDNAFQKWFRSRARFPRYKKKTGRQSFSVACNKREIDWEKKTLSVPKLKNIKICLYRKFEGKIKTITISRDSGSRYYASILVDNGQPLPKPAMVDPGSTIGIDMGIKSLMTFSNGQIVENNRFLPNSLKRLQALGRRVSRKKKGSKNRNKARLRLNKLHQRITDQRISYLHAVTTRLVYENQVTGICLENLHVSSMLKSSRHNLNLRIADASMSEALRQIRYKYAWAGIHCITIDDYAATTKVCNDCGVVCESEIALNVREWQCSNCKSMHDRDINAARNVRMQGLKKAFGEGITIFNKQNQGKGIPGGPVEWSAIAGTMKQEAYICLTLV